MSNSKKFQTSTSKATSDNTERYQAFIENSSEGIWRFELEKPISVKSTPVSQVKHMYKYGYLAEANDVMAQMYGFKSAKSLIGARLGDFLIESDPKNTEYLVAFIQSGYRLSNTESHELDKDGNAKYFRNSLVGFVKDGRLLRAWGTQQDITDQHQATQKLKRSEERLATALTASRMGLWEWNIVTDELTWSDEIKKIFGLPKNAIITFERYQSMIDPVDSKTTEKIINTSLKTGKEYRIEHKIIWPDGSSHWILGHGQPIMKAGKAIRLIGTATNIDEQKEAEQALKESEVRFRTMADSAPVLIWEVGTDKLCNYLNKAWLNFTGRTMEQDLGNGWTESIHPEDYEHCLEVFSSSFDAQQPFSMEYRLRRHDNEYRWILDKGVPRFSSSGEFLGYVGSCMDIHDVKQSEKLKATNETLKAQRTQLLALAESKDEFISIASHQLRTPATGVKQYIGMLLAGYTGELPKQQLDFLTIAYESNERQLTIIDDLLKVAHVDAGRVVLKKTNTDLVRLINSVVDEQKSMFKDRNQITSINHTSDKIMCHLDVGRIRMVFENLLDNASKYSPDNAKITVSLTNDSSVIEIAITDMGVGIAKKDLEKLFQKFSRINNPLSTKVGGTGIGLYWAKQIVDLHNGTISVSSTSKKGSTFTVKLPAF